MMRRLPVFLLVGCICSTSLCAAQNVPGTAADIDATGSLPDYSDALLGDWGGRRGAMSDAGYDWEIVYKLDLIGKVSPLARRPTAWTTWISSLRWMVKRLPVSGAAAGCCMS